MASTPCCPWHIRDPTGPPCLWTQSARSPTVKPPSSACTCSLSCPQLKPFSQSSVHLHRSHQVLSCLHAKQQPAHISMWDTLGRLREAEAESAGRVPSQNRTKDIKLNENKCCSVFPWESQQIRLQKNKRAMQLTDIWKTSWIRYKNLNIYPLQICIVCIYACMEMLSGQKPLTSTSKQTKIKSKHLKKITEHS